MAAYVHITDAEITVNAAVAQVARAECGAIDIFIGAVRNHNKGRKVAYIGYDVCEALAEAVFRQICGEAEELWPQTHYAALQHKGKLAVGGISTIIAVSSPHRADCFAACRYVIEQVKQRAPVWKREYYADGSAEWLPGQTLKPAAANRPPAPAAGGRHG